MRILSAPYFSKSFGGKKIEICTAFTMEKYLNKLSKESFLINNWQWNNQRLSEIAKKILTERIVPSSCKILFQKQNGLVVFRVISWVFFFVLENFVHGKFSRYNFLMTATNNTRKSHLNRSEIPTNLVLCFVNAAYKACFKQAFYSVNYL